MFKIAKISPITLFNLNGFSDLRQVKRDVSIQNSLLLAQFVSIQPDERICAILQKAEMTNINELM